MMPNYSKAPRTLVPSSELSLQKAQGKPGYIADIKDKKPVDSIGSK